MFEEEEKKEETGEFSNEEQDEGSWRASAVYAHSFGNADDPCPDGEHTLYKVQAQGE